jgi:hypothetical protein
MLDLWRPPKDAGDPIGCLATTYTFAPGLFDEQCLARFLEIESEPNREDLAFLLERESRLGGVYAGVLVDHTQAGVEHSLRWDVLPVRIHGGKQHAKLSLLVWSRHVRVIVASANLTDPGYRSNYEVASTVDFSAQDADVGMLAEAVGFLQVLLQLVPGAAESPPEIMRAEAFLKQVLQLVKLWKPAGRRGNVRQHFVFTLPANGAGQSERSSLDEAIQVCRRRASSPNEIWVASPFFDLDEDNCRVAAATCKLMARGAKRDISFFVPAVRDESESDVPRLAAPKSLLVTAAKYEATVGVYVLPLDDPDRNRRPWHAKMLGMFTGGYSALMIGSSNFTCAGMGVGRYRNAEANIFTIADRNAYSREAGLLESVWPELIPVDDPESAEWLGARPENDEEEQAKIPPLPAGFLSATYRAGDQRRIFLRLDPANLPADWRVYACGQDKPELLKAGQWREGGSHPLVELAWEPAQPPEKLLVHWCDKEAFLTLNVEDASRLPPPPLLESMSADDMLWILAAVDPSAAFRAWARQRQPSGLFDTDLDSATPVDLDPLRRYDLQTTFLHRIRRRARVLAQLRANLQRPVAGPQSLEWRLRGMIGIEPLAERLALELARNQVPPDEALLTLADFMIVLHEVDYQSADGSLSRKAFNEVFQLFLKKLLGKLDQAVESQADKISVEAMGFWKRVIKRCEA